MKVIFCSVWHLIFSLRNHNFFFYTPRSPPNRKPALPVILIGEEPCFPGHWLESWRQDIHEGPVWGIYISVQSFPLHLPACQVSEPLCQREDNGCCSGPRLLHTQCLWPSWETPKHPDWGSFPLLKSSHTQSFLSKIRYSWFGTDYFFISHFILFLLKS